MSECLSPAIEDRLDRLEREMCRWKKLATAALACLSLTVLLGAGANVAAEVKAKRFVLVGQDGLPRATLGVTPAGAPTLTFTDPQGQVIWSAP